MQPASSGGSGEGAILDVRDLYAAYGKIEILHGVALEVRRSELVSIIGPNGAGKSTALKSIVGLLPPTRGHVRFADEDITGLRADRVVRRGLAYVPQGRIVFPQMTVLENLEMGAFTVKDPTKAKAALGRVFDLFPILCERQKQNAGTLSGGEQQMLAIARGLMVDPSLLVLDEPSLGLSPKFVGLVFDKILEMKAAGLTMLIVEQNAAKALSVADRAYVLELGKNRFEGPGRDLLNNPEVKRLYLGG